MNNNTATIEKTSVIPTIATLHAKRIGWSRVLFGGLSMYLSIPFWIIIHTIASALCYFGFIAPLLGLKKLDVAHYLVMKDRNLIKDLVLIERLNCEFCSYANGLTTLINAQVDLVADFKEYKTPQTWILLYPAIALVLATALISEVLCIRLIYDHFIAGPLGLHTSRFGIIYNKLKKQGYASNYGFQTREYVLFVKTVCLRFESLLEQIESSWCPIKHLKREQELKYPKHHAYFFEAHEIDKMRYAIETEGTVSKRKPLY